MAWVMTFFRYSFQSPLPWLGKNDFFAKEVVRNTPPKEVAGQYLLKYVDFGMVWETLGWTVLTWVLVYFSIFKGVSVTGKVVYITMLLPLILCGALLIRSVTLENARKGIQLYVGNFSAQKLATGKIWRQAMIQIFFSLGVGFSTFVAYASYNNKHANAVQATLIIACSNSAFEVIVGFAAFAIIGFLDINLDDPNLKLGSFDVGFLTYPQALARLPGANIWAGLFFLTIYLLAIDSGFALTESFASVVIDTEWGKKVKKQVMMAIVCFIAMLCSIVYSTKFGMAFLDAIDIWLNSITLLFCAWAQVVAVTSIYRYKDVVAQCGFQAYALAQVSYITSMFLFALLTFTVKMYAGIAVFFCVLIFGTVAAASIAKSPEIKGGFGNKKFFNALWWLTTYSGTMLTRDLNAVIAQGKNWSLPGFWAPMLRWVTAPVLVYILGIGYEDFIKDREGNGFKKDPLHWFGFTLSHLGVAFVILGYIYPRSFAIWVPKKHLESDQRQYIPGPGNTLLPEGAECDSLKSVPFDAFDGSAPNTPKAVEHMA